MASGAVPASTTGPPVFAFDKIYRTDDEAYDAIAQAYNAIGFPLSKKRSKANPKTGIKNRIDVRCHKSGTYRPWKHNSNQYQTSSRKSNCPFYVIIRFDKHSGGFFFEVVSEEHNHEPVDNPLDSCRSRRQSQVHFGLVRLEKLIEARSRIPGLTSKNIAEQIVNEHPNLALSRNDVLCIQNKLRRSRTGAFGSIQVFLDSLAESDRVFYFAADKGSDDKVSKIFWIYHSNIEDWKRSPEVLMFDNTYKVNRLKMPLLQINGITPLYTNFSAGFGLTAKEDLVSYAWILKQLKIAATKARVPLPMAILTDFDDVSLKKAAAEVFDTSDQQVCMWHILKDVTLNIQKKWVGSTEGSIIMSHRVPTPTPPAAGSIPFHRHGEDLLSTPLELEIDQATESAIQVSWQALQLPPPPDLPMGGPRKFSESADGIRDAWVEVCRAESENEFWQRWAQLCYEFPMQKDITKYLLDTYVPERHQFAQYSVKWFHNYGIRQISRNKSSSLKDFFDDSSTDLCQLEDSIWEMVSSYRETYELALQRDLGRRQGHWDEYSIVKDIESSVGSKTMEEILKQVRCALHEFQGKLPSQPCTGHFRKQMGLPCRHELLSLLQQSQLLTQEHIDRHWWINQSDDGFTEEPDRGFKLIQVKLNYNPPRESPAAQSSAQSRTQYAFKSRTQNRTTPAISPPADPGVQFSRVQSSVVPRVPGTRPLWPSHKADGRVRVSRSTKEGVQPVQGRRKLQRRNQQSVQAQVARDEQTNLQEATQQKDVVDQVPSLVNEAPGPGQQQLVPTPTVPSTSVSHSVGTSDITQGQASHGSVAENPQHQPNQDRHAGIPLANPPLPPHHPMVSYMQNQPMPSQVNGNPSPANYQQFEGMDNLNLYNISSGTGQQPTRAFDGQELQYTFRAWQPPQV